MDKEIRIVVMSDGTMLIGEMEKTQPEVSERINNPRLVMSAERGVRLVELIGAPDVIDLHQCPSASYVCKDRTVLSGYIKATSGLVVQ